MLVGTTREDILSDQIRYCISYISILSYIHSGYVDMQNVMVSGTATSTQLDTLGGWLCAGLRILSGTATLSMHSIVSVAEGQCIIR